MTEYEFEAKNQGYRLIAGIDEAGRGPLAGPVVAACVLLATYNFDIPIRDSKKLSCKQRQHAFDKIVLSASIGIGVLSPKIIDQVNIYRATELAMSQAVMNMDIDPDYLLIDGTMKVNSNHPQLSIIRGDQKSISIAAASIVAKVTRDKMMLEAHSAYPQYRFDKHKGYGTALHLKLLREHGPTPIHRKSFSPVKETFAIS